jgi:hypothetical protein
MDKSVFSPSLSAPHLVLGVPYGCTSDEAVAAFAFKSRRVKSGESSEFSIEDLTAALSEIQQGARPDAVELRFTVPANPTTFASSATFGHNSTIFGSDEHTSELVGLKLATDESDSAATVYLAASIKALFDWRWHESGQLARECLRYSQDEDERDEALNVLAASHLMGGEYDKAVQALQKAVEGRWNLSLQANLALIATIIDPRLASAQMGYLIDGASGVQEKLRAARMAIGLWRTSQADELQDEDLEPLSAELCNAIYDLLLHQEISEEDFFDIALFLARMDNDRERLCETVDESKFSSSSTARVVVARVDGLFEYIDELAVASSQDKEHQMPWIQDKVDDMVRSVNKALFDDDGCKTGVSLAFRILSKGVDSSNFERTAMRFIVASQLGKALDEGAMPADEFARWHLEGTTALTKIDLQPEQRELLEYFQKTGGDRLGALTFIALIDVYNNVVDHANKVIQRMSGFLNRMSADKDAIRRVSHAINITCQDAVKDYNRVLPLITDIKIREAVVNHTQQFRNVIEKIDSYL